MFWILCLPSNRTPSTLHSFIWEIILSRELWQNHNIFVSDKCKCTLQTWTNSCKPGLCLKGVWHRMIEPNGKKKQQHKVQLRLTGITRYEVKVKSIYICDYRSIMCIYSQPLSPAFSHVWTLEEDNLQACIRYPHLAPGPLKEPVPIPTGKREGNCVPMVSHAGASQLARLTVGWRAVTAMRALTCGAALHLLVCWPSAGPLLLAPLLYP